MCKIIEFFLKMWCNVAMKGKRLRCSTKTADFTGRNQRVKAEHQERQ